MSIASQVATPNLHRGWRPSPLMVGLAGGGSVVIGLLMLRSESIVAVVGIIAGLLITAGVASWIWNDPIRGVYFIFGAAVLLATYESSDLVDFIGSYLPFFPDIKGWSPVGLIFSIGEVVMLITVVSWLLRGIAARNLNFRKGTLAVPIALYMALVVFAEARGIGSGGSFRISLFEVRSQVYMLLAYILVCNLIKTRKHIMTLLWILLVAAGARAIEGSIYFLFVLRPSNHYQHQLYPHEQSYFFNGLLTLVVILYLFRGSRTMKRFALAVMPFVIVADLANNRRASIAALVLAMPIILILTAIAQPRWRRTITWGLVIVGAAFVPYFLAYQHKTGLLSLPARAIVSTVHPSAADASSDQYRVAEDLDIMTTVKSSPIFGYGFGKPMFEPATLPKIGYVFALIMPHNSILWVWMRLGTIGYLLLWLLLGTAIVQISHLAVRAPDRMLQGVAAFVLVMLIQQVIISYYDLQWSNYRTMITTGVLLGLISVIDTIAKAERAEQIKRVVQQRKQAMPGRRVAATAGVS